MVNDRNKGKSENIFDFASRTQKKDKRKVLRKGGVKKVHSAPKTQSKKLSSPESTNDSENTVVQKSMIKKKRAAKIRSNPSIQEPKEPISVVDRASINELSQLFDDKELGERFAAAMAYAQELEKRVERVYESMGVDPRDAEKQLHDPKMPVDVRKELIERAKDLEKELFHGKIKGIRRKVLAKRIIKKGKRLQRKTLGKRKGWISM